MATTQEITWLCQMVQQRSGIILNHEKAYLIESRLKPICDQHRCADLSVLITKLRKEERSPILNDVVDALTTNETFFFRDIAPFEALREQVLPDLIRKRSTEKKLRIWCAAASTGQEPLSIMMTLREYFPLLQAWEVTFLATDISAKALDRCRVAKYTQQEIERGLAPELAQRYFVCHNKEWEAKESLRRGIAYRAFNLQDSWAGLGTFDLVFMRNVLIYFDVENKRSIFGKIRKVLAPDGYLFLGGAESPVNIDPYFVRLPYERGGVYHCANGTPPPLTAEPQVGTKSDRYPTVGGKSDRYPVVR